MHVMPVERAKLQRKCSLASNKTTLVPNKEKISFKSYGTLIHEITQREIKTQADAQKALKTLLDALKNEGKIVNSRAYNALMDYSMDYNVNMCLRYFGKPINVLSDKLRNVIFETKKDDVDILRINNDNKLILQNRGQRGFFSCLFDSNDADNDIRLIFMAPKHIMEYGLKDNGKLYMEQYYDKHWKISVFDFSGKLEKCDSGYYESSFVPPPF